MFQLLMIISLLLPVQLPNAVPVERELWLAIGQSNSIGRSGDTDTSLDTLDDRIKEINHDTGEAQTLQIPTQAQLGATEPRATTPPFLSFAKRRLETNPNLESVLFVNRGVGGTGFSDNRWNEDDDLYDLAVNELNQAKIDYPNYTFKGILWHQGETDALAEWTQAQYETALGNMVTAMRADVGDVPFILGTMSHAWIDLDSARQGVDNAHRNHSAYITDSYLVDLSDLPASPDDIHFSNASYRTMGIRYANVLT